ncbi:tartrate dehydrogenase [Fonsecaea nubica]|uniref:D-malate dehydrogenase (decarboxylating) n=1 Tax=Fonsecaea nubica TaxID=856822 RepID=A0A178CID9_9EURO|nr:tartrate dehydrogenase [Fonsecaea nubica]OAL29729.1 tartrate dehydrogenase [Fonsecaea nubica]
MEPEYKRYRIASIPGDGIGPEVISAGIAVLETLSKAFSHLFTFEFTPFDWSSDKYLKDGRYVPENGLEELRTYDAILFGAVGDRRVPDHISLWGLRLAICQPLQQFANVRPTRILRGVTSPLSACQGTLENAKKLDWVIIRENSEGEYAGHGGRSHVNQAWEVGTEVSVFTRHGCERLLRFAYETARARPRKTLTFVTKSNAQRNGMVLWDEVNEAVARDFPDVRSDKMLVDAMTCRMVLQPETIDVVVATNLHADILSDLAASLAGSIGIAPTSNLDPTRKNPSMFEPIHGSAWDIAGQGVANPIGTFWTCAEMVRWLGQPVAADVLMAAIERTLDAGVKTRDLGGNATTAQVTDRVCADIFEVVREQAVVNGGK